VLKIVMAKEVLPETATIEFETVVFRVFLCRNQRSTCRFRVV